MKGTYTSIASQWPFHLKWWLPDCSFQHVFLKPLALYINSYASLFLITACWPGGWNLGHRMKVAEKGMKSLLMEADALRQEVALCKSNLDRAQEQVLLLYTLTLAYKCAWCSNAKSSPAIVVRRFTHVFFLINLSEILICRNFSFDVFQYSLHTLTVLTVWIVRYWMWIIR